LIDGTSVSKSCERQKIPDQRFQVLRITLDRIQKIKRNCRIIFGARQKRFRIASNGCQRRFEFVRDIRTKSRRIRSARRISVRSWKTTTAESTAPAAFVTGDTLACRFYCSGRDLKRLHGRACKHASDSILQLRPAENSRGVFPVKSRSVPRTLRKDVFRERDSSAATQNHDSLAHCLQNQLELLLAVGQRLHSHTECLGHRVQRRADRGDPFITRDGKTLIEITGCKLSRRYGNFV
jgi:hypothetical protein